MNFGFKVPKGSLLKHAALVSERVFLSLPGSVARPCMAHEA